MASERNNPKPLMLKDFLRLDNPNSDATSVSGFRPSSSTTTVLYLLEVDARKNRREAGAAAAAVRDETFRWGRNPLSSKLSAVMNTVKTLPFISSSFGAKGGSSILPRSFSRKFLQRSFWKKRIVEEESKNVSSTSFSGNKVLIRDIIRLGPFLDDTPPEKQIISGRNSFSGSSSGWSLSESTTSTTTTSSGSDSIPSSSSSISSEFTKAEKISSGDDTTVTATCRCEDPKENGGMVGGCNRCEDKEQFSPVFVMDFSYAEEEEEEEPTTVLCSKHHLSLSELENKRHHLIQKIRRFKCFSQFVDPINLRRSFDSELEPELEEEEEEQEEEEGARELLEELKSTGILRSDCNDRLLLDFFNEGLWSHRRRENSRTTTWREVEDRTVKEELLSTSINWIQGSGLEVLDDWVELQINEMNKDREWKCFHVEEGDDMAADVESLVFGSLIDDLFIDLLLI